MSFVKQFAPLLFAGFLASSLNFVSRAESDLPYLPLNDTEYIVEFIEDANLPDEYQVEEFTTSISFTTSVSRDFNNQILGLNSSIATGLAGAVSYDHTNQQEFIRELDPDMLRFPLGVFGNFYDWRVDTRYMDMTDRWTYDKNGSHGGACVKGVIDDRGKLNYIYQTDGETNIKDLRYPNIRNGVKGLTTLQKQMDFDILWVWSCSYDNLIDGEPADDRAGRYNYYIHDLQVPVTHIELGNELFFLSQRSEELNGDGWDSLTNITDRIGNINTKRICRYAKEIAAAADAAGVERPLFALPFSWRGRQSGGTSYNNHANNAGHHLYNRALLFPDRDVASDNRHKSGAVASANDQTWYDAMVLHKYVGSHPNGAMGDGNEVGVLSDDLLKMEILIKTAYEARFAWQDEIRYFQDLLPNGVTKPIWVTEWGVTCGMFAASYLSMADAYLYMMERPSIEIVSWFQTHGVNKLYLTKGTADSVIHTKSGYGAVFEMLKSVFRDSELYETTVESKCIANGATPKISRQVSPASKEGEHYYPAVEGVDFVTAQALKMADGAKAIFVVNKSNRAVKTTIRVDGVEYIGSFTRHDIAFESLLHNPEWEMTESPLTKSSFSAGQTVIIKPYSVTLLRGM